MAIKKVTIESGCISCGMCESICPKVFAMPNEAEVIDGADLNANEEGIKEAASSCPIDIIKYEV